MLIQSKENKPTEILIPEGSVEKALLQALTAVDVPFEPRQAKCYAFALPTLEMLVTINRTKNIPGNLRKKDNTAVMGIVGSDVATEYNLASPEPFDPAAKEWRQVPLATPKVKMAWMTTPNAQQKFGELERNSADAWQKLTSGVIYASYPQIAADYLDIMQGITLPLYEETSALPSSRIPKQRIEKAAGKVEAQWYNTPTNYLIADLIEGGTTMQANKLTYFAEIMPFIANVLLTAMEKASPADLQRQQDLIGIVYEAKSIQKN
ncbi:MAG: hypothetical protein QG639_504, partial [Patescibacteria group bacterium]|nr:hypothetical protein [Patescibacteria group bacterium]